MRAEHLKFLTPLLVYTLSMTLLTPIGLRADDHLVPSAELRQKLSDQAQTRADELAKVNEFFSSGASRKALRKAGIDEQKVSRAVALLSNDELARLSAETAKTQKDFRAGALTNEHLTYIVIALATAVIILVIVAA
jgi:hypothetical protein